MNLQNFLVNTNNPKKQSWRNFRNFTYEFLENNKDKLMETYGIKQSYNPTDLNREFEAWSKANGLPPVTEPIHNRPVHITAFLAEKYFLN